MTDIQSQGRRILGGEDFAKFSTIGIFAKYCTFGTHEHSDTLGT